MTKARQGPEIAMGLTLGEDDMNDEIPGGSYDPLTATWSNANTEREPIEMVSQAGLEPRLSAEETEESSTAQCPGCGSKN